MKILNIHDGKYAMFLNCLIKNTGFSNDMKRFANSTSMKKDLIFKQGTKIFKI